jgi:hypothetical protein
MPLPKVLNLAPDGVIEEQGGGRKPADAHLSL